MLLDKLRIMIAPSSETCWELCSYLRKASSSLIEPAMFKSSTFCSSVFQHPCDILRSVGGSRVAFCHMPDSHSALAALPFAERSCLNYGIGQLEACGAVVIPHPTC
eukprot:533067-Amphidinium_carterae.1